MKQFNLSELFSNFQVDYVSNLIPLGVGCLVVDVCCDISDLIVIKATSEGGHGVLSVGNLILIVAVALEGVMAK